MQKSPLRHAAVKGFLFYFVTVALPSM